MKTETVILKSDKEFINSKEFKDVKLEMYKNELYFDEDIDRVIHGDEVVIYEEDFLRCYRFQDGIIIEMRFEEIIYNNESSSYYLKVWINEQGDSQNMSIDYKNETNHYEYAKEASFYVFKSEKEITKKFYKFLNSQITISERELNIDFILESKDESSSKKFPND